MPESKGNSNFWTTLQGILTVIAALITAIGGAYGIYISSQSSLPITGGPSSPPENVEKHDLRVYAKAREGSPFTNKTGEHATVNFDAKGSWLAIPEGEPHPKIPETARGYIAPDGDPNFQPNDMPCNQYPLGALVVKGEDDLCKAAVGSKGTFELKPGETVYFLMNDVTEINPYDLYKDNDGFVDVEWSMSTNQ